jgi:hypothetical protein
VLDMKITGLPLDSDVVGRPTDDALVPRSAAAIVAKLGDRLGDTNAGKPSG